MGNTPAVCATVLGSPTVVVTGDPPFLSSLGRSARECEALIPGLRLAEASHAQGDCPSLEFRVAAAPCMVSPSDRGALRLEGDPAGLTREVWADLLLTLCAQAMESRGLFWLDASAVLVGDNVLLLADPPGSGQAAAALELGLQRHPVLSTRMCLVDASMRLLAGTRRFLVSRYFLRKHFASLWDGRESLAPLLSVWLEEPSAPAVCPIGDTGRAFTVAGIYHLHLDDDSGWLRPVAEQKAKMVLSSHLISRPACRAAVIGPWRMILPRRCDSEGEERRRAAIFALAGLPHTRAGGRLRDVVSRIAEECDAPAG